jgi:rhamnosyltransferase
VEGDTVGVMTVPRISVIVRARNEAAGIGRCLRLLGEQDLEPGTVEVIVVDNESSDGTAEIAARHGARVLSMPQREFSFGRALNLAALQARGEVLVALSAHAYPLDAGWLARLAAALDDPRVACASGERFWPDGSPLTEPVAYDVVLAATHPRWGYSNAAGAFRASLWREQRFREDLPGCEDIEWGRFWALRGFTCVLDPALLTDHDHTHDPIPDIFRRARREAAGQAMFLGLKAPTPAGLAKEWFTDTRFYDDPWRARFSHRRLARLAGAYAGGRYGGGASPNGTRATFLRAWISRLWRRASGIRRNAST